MHGLGLLNQPPQPFWQVVPKEGVTQNPLGYYCAPNGASPNYVAAHSISDFIAYGFIQCWNSLSPDYFTMWNMVEAQDVQWLRQYFLEVLECTILALYRGDIGPDTDDFDTSDWGRDLYIGDTDNEKDDEGVVYTWEPHRICSDDNTLSMVLHLVDDDGSAGDDEVYWLDLDALKDRAAVKAAFDKAYQVNNNGEPAFRVAMWKEALESQPLEDEA